MAASAEVPLRPELHRQTSFDREQFLIKYVTDKCAAREEIELEEVTRTPPASKAASPRRPVPPYNTPAEQHLSRDT